MLSKRCQRVGDDKFFEQAEEQSLTCGIEHVERQTGEWSAEIFDETLDAVNGTSGEGREEDDVSEIFAQVHRWEAA